MTPATFETVRMGIVIAAGVLFVVAALIGLVRLSKGPTTLDRAVSTDLLLGIVIAALAAEAIVHRHTTTLPVMLVLALLSFGGPVAIARFIGDPPKLGTERRADTGDAAEDASGSDASASDPASSDPASSDGSDAGDRSGGEPGWGDR